MLDVEALEKLGDLKALNKPQPAAAAAKGAQAVNRAQIVMAAYSASFSASARFVTRAGTRRVGCQRGMLRSTGAY